MEPSSALSRFSGRADRGHCSFRWLRQRCGGDETNQVPAILIEAFVRVAEAVDVLRIHGLWQEKAVGRLRRIARPLALPARTDEAAAKEGAVVRCRGVRMRVLAPAA